MAIRLGDPKRENATDETLLVVVPVEGIPERDPASPLVAMEADEAREWALKVLAAAGPDGERMVRNYRAGGVLVTVESPQHALPLEPWLFVRPRDAGEFEDALDMFGGLLAFREPQPESTSLYANHEAAEGGNSDLTVNLALPKDMAPMQSPIPATQRLIEQRRTQAAQVAEEQAAGERLTADLIAEQTTTGRLLRRLQELGRAVTVEELASATLISVETARAGVRELVDAKLVDESEEDPPMLTPGRAIEDVQMRREEEGVVFEAVKSHGPITQAALAEMLPDHAADLGNTLTNLIVANVIRVESPEGDADTRFEQNPGWTPCFDGEPGSALGYHEERGE